MSCVGALSSGGAVPAVGRSAAGESKLVAVELEQIPGGGDQSPFRASGGSSAAQETVDAAVELGVSEDGLDHHLTSAVELISELAFQDAAHEGVASAVPA